MITIIYKLIVNIIPYFCCKTQDRIHEKFMNRETIISREIKLLKNKFEVLEKNRQFRTMFQKSPLANGTADEDLNSGLDGSADGNARKRSETGTTLTASELDDKRQGGANSSGGGGGPGGGVKGVRIKMSKLGGLGQLFEPIFGSKRSKKSGGRFKGRRKSNKVSSIASISDSAALDGQQQQAEASSVVVGSTIAEDPSAQQQHVNNIDDDSEIKSDGDKKKKKKPSLFGRLMKS